MNGPFARVVAGTGNCRTPGPDGWFQGVGRLKTRSAGVNDRVVTTDIDTLATALHVKTDDLLGAAPQPAPWRPKVGIAPSPTDAELVTPAVIKPC